jgi:anti-anti-sigma factor
MLKPNLVPVQTDGFSIATETTGTVIRLRISGSCDMVTATLLESYLRALHAEAVRTKAQTVVVDCESMYFLNSSSIKILVTWIAKIQKLDHKERYGVEFHTNQKLGWQKRSLEGVRNFAMDIVRIDPGNP